jgi:hypothetical protein
VTEREFQDVLRYYRDGIIDDMRRNGFYYGPPPGKLRYDATPYDVNQGRCGAFAQLIVDEVPEAEYFYVGTLDPRAPDPEGTTPYDCAHAYVKWRGKYYDAECISGVKDWRRLPAIKNRDKSRTRVLREWRASGRKDCV